MKKLLALLLVVVIAFAFAACVPFNEFGLNDEQPEVNDEQFTNSEGDEIEEKKEFSRGVINGLTYENEFLGLGCTLDSDWSFYNDEQMKLLPGGENSNIIYDMYAQNKITWDNIGVNFQKMSDSDLEEYDFNANYTLVYEELKSAYERMGYTNFSYTIENMNVAGRTIPCLKMSYEAFSEGVYQLMISIKCNGYMASIAISTYEEDRCDEILAKFYAV